MYAPITTFNISYPRERPWKRLPIYYTTTFQKCKWKFKLFESAFQSLKILSRSFSIVPALANSNVST